MLLRSFMCPSCKARFASVERLGLEVLRRATGVPPIARAVSAKEGEIKSAEPDQENEQGEKEAENTDGA